MSFRIQKREDGRYIIITPKADKIIDDCRGYGYYTSYSAYYGFVLYASKRYQKYIKYRREQRKHEGEKASSQTNRERPLSV